MKFNRVLNRPQSPYTLKYTPPLYHGRSSAEPRHDYWLSCVKYRAEVGTTTRISGTSLLDTTDRMEILNSRGSKRRRLPRVGYDILDGMGTTMVTAQDSLIDNCNSRPLPQRQ